LFVSLEDETGICNLVVMAETFEKYRQAIVGHDFIEVWGKIERVGMVVHVKVDKAAPLMPQPSLRLPTRDFR
jgi:error-prone DNA polymerase